MTTQTTPRKKGGIWFLLVPVLVIILLLIITKYYPTHVISDESLKETSATQNQSGQDQTQELATAIFSPNDIIAMINRDEDYIAGVCSKHGFEYSVSNESVFTYSYNKPYQLSEFVTTWRDSPNKLNYCIGDDKRYSNFIAELLKLNPTLLHKDQYDKDFPDSSHLLLGNCVFIPMGYKKNFKGYCIMAIRKDKVSSVKDMTRKSAEKEESEKKKFILKLIYHSYCTIKASNTKVYFSPDISKEKKDILDQGNVFIRTEKNGFMKKTNRLILLGFLETMFCMIL